MFKHGRFFVGALISLAICCTATASEMDAARDKLATIEITENTIPEIKELYNNLSDLVAQSTELQSKYQSDLQQNADAMHEKEHSTANKLIGAAGIGMTGIGGMQLLSGKAEQSADQAAEQDMQAYLNTFRCDYGGGKTFRGGEREIELPGAGMLTEKYNEYIALASDLKTRKESLGMMPGIESEEIIDSVTSGLYDDVGVGITDGVYTSISRALLDETGEDAAEFATQKQDAESQVKTGTALAATGAIGSAVADMVVNKDAPKERSDEITHEYESDMRKLESQVADTNTQLQAALDKNAARVQQYNELLATYREKLSHTCDNNERGPCFDACQSEFDAYDKYLAGLNDVTDQTQAVDIDTTEQELKNKLAAWQECIESERARLAAIAQKRAECESRGGEFVNDECVMPQTPAVATDDPSTATDDPDASINPDAPAETEADTDDTDDDNDETSVAAAVVDDTLCPDENLRFKGASGKHVGDFCSYGNVAQGKIIKFTTDNKNKRPAQIAGQCTCSAIRCQPGFGDANGNPVNGMCNETVADAAGMCLKKEFDAVKENIDISPKSTACATFCAEYAKKNKCTDSKKHMTIKSKKMCVCNMSAQDQADIANRQKAAQKYYAVCGPDKGKSGGKEYCIEDVFTDSGNGINLNTGVMQGIAFAEEYIRYKYNINATCNEQLRTSGNDDFLKCTSADNKTFFEVRFDDLTESVDDDRIASQLNTVCKIYGLTYVKPGSAGVACRRSNGNNPKTMYLGTTAADCEKIRPLVSRLARNVVHATRAHKYDGTVRTINISACWMDAPNYQASSTESTMDKLAKIDGLDNMHFYGIHTLSDHIHSAVRDYVQGVKGANTNVHCKNDTTRIDSIHGRSDNDEILHCTVNGAPIDFVFDDTTELFWYERKAGASGLGCAALGGTYTGEGCVNVGESECKKLATRLASTCPSCSKPVWQESENRCYLPDSNAADNINFAGKIGAVVATVAAGVVITIISGGSGAVPATLAILEAVGGVMEITAEVRIQQSASNFLAQTTKCPSNNCTNCAESILNDLHTHIAQAHDYDSITIQAIDAEMSRLIECVPADSEIIQKVNNGLINSNEGITGEWTDDQILRAAGIALGLSSFITGIIKAVAKTGTKMAKTTSELTRKLTAVEKNVHQQQVVDRAAAGTLTDADRAEIAADGNKTLRQSVARVTTETKTAEQIANDGGKLKEYDQLMAKQNRSVTENQRLNEIRNSWGNPSDDIIDAARTEQTRMAASAEIQQARDELAKYDEWAAKNPGAAKNQSRARQAEIDALRQRVADADVASPTAKQVSSTPAPKPASKPASEPAAENVSTPAQEPNYAFVNGKLIEGDEYAAWQRQVDNQLGAATDTKSVNNIADDAEIEVVGFERPSATPSVASKADIDTPTLRGVKQKLGLDDVSNLPDGYMISGRQYNTLSDLERQELFKELDAKGLEAREFHQRNGAGGYQDSYSNFFIIKKGHEYRHIDVPKIPNLDAPITKIHGYDVFVETIPGSNGQKVGMVSGRPVVVVNVNGRRIPMYASSGSAGKLDVPTGKWEFVAGIHDNGGKPGWFNKGGLEQILNHYNSPELRQIAEALDATIGDVRNVEDIVATASRRAYNGKGIVANVDNLYDLGNSAGLRFINSGMKHSPGGYKTEKGLLNAPQNIKDIREFLNNL